MPTIEDNTQVPSAEPVEVPTTPGTLNTTGSVADATPPAAQVDAESLARLKEQLAKYEQDVRNLKSASDKRLHQASTEWQQKEEQLRHELQEVRLSTMDEDARAKYLREIDQTRARELEKKATQAERTAADYEASLSAIAYYTNLGVPLSELALNEGYDALFQSGFKYITTQYKKATAAPAAPATTTPPLPPTAPGVVTSNGSTPNLKPTMADLVKTYGDMETVYRLVEQGRLDPAIIPT